MLKDSKIKFKPINWRQVFQAFDNSQLLYARYFFIEKSLSFTQKVSEAYKFS